MARAINRSEGALRKWLRGQSEPGVSDLRAICEATGTSAEWLVMGRGDPQPGSLGGGLAVRDGQEPYGAGPELPPLNYKLMDEVVRSVREERPALLGTETAAEKQSAVLTTLYNMSRRSRRVDREEVSRVVGLTA